MIIKGLQKFSLLDYPGKLSCIVFVANCNFRCGFCHNRDLVLNSPQLPQIPEEEVFAFLEKRKGQLDGVVITGGEPTLYPDLIGFVGQIRLRGYLVKLDTNGSSPKTVENLTKNKLVDYWAMDIKGPLDRRYAQISKSEFLMSIIDSIKLIVNSGVDYEFRTTVVPGIHGKSVLIEMAKQLRQYSNLAIQQCNNFHWYLQQFLPKNCLDPEFTKIKPHSYKEMEEMLKEVRKIIPRVSLRGATS